MPGLWNDAGGSHYLHSDHLGTLRQTTNGSGALESPRIFTAFGERIAGPTSLDRYGYVGAEGYQADAAIPFLHLGARYYDPSTGRFLQRDPIGIAGGTNVYGYVGNTPTQGIDPSGLRTDPTDNAFWKQKQEEDRQRRQNEPPQPLVIPHTRPIGTSVFREITGVIRKIPFTKLGDAAHRLSRYRDILSLLEIGGDERRHIEPPSDESILEFISTCQ